MNDDFVHLHTHSDASAFDGLGKPSEFVELAAEMGQPALALTEHGTGRSIYTAAKAARDCGITYIPGCEMYLTDDATLRGLTPDEKKAIKKRISDPDEAKRIIKEENSNRKERDHITVWALDQDGLRNLYRLLHYSWNEGFHYKPRVDMKVLRRFSEGIAVSTGCPGGVITKPMRDSDEKTARARMTELKDIFGDRLYVEVMPHVPDPTCVGLAKRMTTLAADYGCTVLATQDAHYPGSTDAVCQDALLCQPPGTKVRRVVQRSRVGHPRGEPFPLKFEEAPIEDIQAGDKVVSWDGRDRRGTIHRAGSPVAKVGVREFDGDLIKITVPEKGLSSRYTPDHKTIARLDGSLEEGNFVVYLMRRGDQFRVGITRYRRVKESRRGQDLGPMYRLKEEMGDSLWILSAHKTRDDAREQEAWVSHAYGIPTWTFTKPGDRAGGRKEFYARLWVRVGPNLDRAAGCLEAFRRDVRFPLLTRGMRWMVKPKVVRACNLMSGMLVCAPDESAVGRTYHGTGAWSPIVVEREPYSGPVYSMDVERDHTYVADGIVTHNCIHTKSTLADPDRFAFDTTDYWMKPRIEYLKSANKADSSLKWAKFCDNTVEFADRVTCEVELDQPGRYLAAPKLPVGIKDYDSWVMKLCLEGAKSRGIPIATAPAYKERLFYELREIRRRGFSSYFCVCWEVRKWCRDNGKLCGPGRGSGGGSLVNYLLRITDIDPVKYDLSFDRFLAPGRQGLPDVDLDFASHDRQDVIQHLRDEYGEEHVAHISTHICLGGRATLRDLGRICSVPVADIEGIASMIHTAQSEEAKDDESLSTILKTTKLGKEFAERYPDVAELCGRLEGQLRTVGVHAGGIVISSEVLSSITPMESTQGPRGRVAMTAYDMDGIEDIGCVKLDVLGLTTLRTCSLAFEDAGLDPSFIDFEDTDVLKAFTDQRFGDIFQFDTPSARRVCADFEFRWLGDIAAMTALNRPGPLLSGMVEQFMERHRVKSAPPGPHPIYDEVFKETYGVPVYQEQVIELVKRLCGYSAVDADKFRRAVGKKKGLGDHHEPFVDGACASGMDLKDAEELFGKITGFAQYAFNKSHSYTYSALAFWTMALKVHAPASFYAAALETRRGNTVKQLRLCAEARAEGIPVEPPDVNVPTASGFAVDRARGLRILGSLADIKGIGPKAAKAIADNAPYTSVSDFALRTGKAVNLGHFKALTKASAFRSVVSDRKALAENPEGAWRTGLTPHGPEYADEDEEALVIGSVWPIYRSITGASSFSATLAKVKGEIGPNVLVPGDNYLQGPGGRMVMALPSSLNLYTDGKTGGKTGRAIMVSADGEELSLRIDSDTAEFAHLLEGDQPAVLWTFLAQKGRRRSIERAWPVDGLTRLARTLAQGKGPRLGDKIDAMKPDQKATIPFLVVRRKAHRDKRGNKMLTLGGMAGRDYIRVLVFSSRMAKDVKDLEVGQTRRIQIKKLDRGGLCLGDRDVS